ncbi:MAG: HAD hydrolase-like protein [Alphaproteobacteria bacterium]|nr:HAD hydrolase-like protein [Alphaproteobacteria bacterium]
MAALDPARIEFLSFDVYGTLVGVRDGSYDAFQRILDDAGAGDVDVRAFWEHWEELNIAAYWKPYRPYRDICRASLEQAFADYGVRGDAGMIQLYFDAFPRFQLYPDVAPTLDALARRFKLAIVSNIDDDLLARTPLGRRFDLVCTAERARGYKPDGKLFHYLVDRTGAAVDRLLHSGQSQFTDLVGGKPLGLTIAWINRRGIALSPTVPRPDHVLPDIKSLLPLLRA